MCAVAQPSPFSNPFFCSVTQQVCIGSDKLNKSWCTHLVMMSGQTTRLMSSVTSIATNANQTKIVSVRIELHTEEHSRCWAVIGKPASTCSVALAGHADNLRGRAGWSPAVHSADHHRAQRHEKTSHRDSNSGPCWILVWWNIHSPAEHLSVVTEAVMTVVQGCLSSDDCCVMMSNDKQWPQLSCTQESTQGIRHGRQVPCLGGWHLLGPVTSQHLTRRFPVTIFVHFASKCSPCWVASGQWKCFRNLHSASVQITKCIESWNSLLSWRTLWCKSASHSKMNQEQKPGCAGSPGKMFEIFRSFNWKTSLSCSSDVFSLSRNIMPFQSLLPNGQSLPQPPSFLFSIVWPPDHGNHVVIHGTVKLLCLCWKCQTAAAMSAEINCTVFHQNCGSALEVLECTHCRLKTATETALFHIWMATNGPRRIISPKQGSNYDCFKGVSAFGVNFRTFGAFFVTTAGTNRCWPIQGATIDPFRVWQPGSRFLITEVHQLTTMLCFWFAVEKWVVWRQLSVLSQCISSDVSTAMSAWSAISNTLLQHHELAKLLWWWTCMAICALCCVNHCHFIHCFIVLEDLHLCLHHSCCSWGSSTCVLPLLLFLGNFHSWLPLSLIANLLVSFLDTLVSFLDTLVSLGSPSLLFWMMRFWGHDRAKWDDLTLKIDLIWGMKKNQHLHQGAGETLFAGSRAPATPFQQ